MLQTGEGDGQGTGRVLQEYIASSRGGPSSGECVSFRLLGGKRGAGCEASALMPLSCVFGGLSRRAGHGKRCLLLEDEGETSVLGAVVQSAEKLEGMGFFCRGTKDDE